VPKEIVKFILKDLTYGERGQKKPDPVLQPIIPISEEQYVIAPSVLLSSSPERNLLALLNRIPSERKIYSRLKNEKENLMRSNIQTQLSNHGYRFWSGNIPEKRGLPDVDLAIIDNVEKICLICELKWFIGPAEIREVVHRSEDITKGIEQMRKLINYYSSNRMDLLNLIGLSSDFQIYFTVISENSIGHSSVQDKMISVINSSHIIHKLHNGYSLKAITHWLKKREYLPIENIHFKMRQLPYSIGKWKTNWSGFEGLVDDSLINHT
ncbi:MAG: hypothetical protein IH825_06610, partial [Candidatus Marinimicrobia bacterium]|nr:hypothetical protein [Candidatus Neomarinimicrobiota bacterium]